MLASEGIEVLRLIRIAIGPLTLGSLAKGEVRPLTSSEKTTLDALDQFGELASWLKDLPEIELDLRLLARALHIHRKIRARTMPGKQRINRLQ